ELDLLRASSRYQRATNRRRAQHYQSCPGSSGPGGCLTSGKGMEMDLRTGIEPLPNFVGGQWQQVDGTEQIEVRNPATGERIASVVASASDAVDAAVDAATRALKSWREVPPTDRVQYLFKLKN